MQKAKLYLPRSHRVHHHKSGANDPKLPQLHDVGDLFFVLHIDLTLILLGIEERHTVLLFAAEPNTTCGLGKGGKQGIFPGQTPVSSKD